MVSTAPIDLMETNAKVDQHSQRITIRMMVMMMSKKGGCDCCRVKRTDKPAMREGAEVQIGPKCAHCVHFNSCALIGVREIDRGEGLGNKVYREQKTG